LKSILRRLREFAGILAPVPLPGVIHLPALGQHWTVKYRPTASRSVQARSNGRGILVVSGRVVDDRKIMKGIRRWLVRQTRESLIPWLDELSDQAGLTYRSVSVRGQRTRWASCSSKGGINLNYRLLFLSPEIVRYILIHELCHTVHPDHSRRFWSKVASLEPEYRVLDGLAKRGMEEVPEWAKMP
jgi:predicted metal-dependent hydrolase